MTGSDSQPAESAAGDSDMNATRDDRAGACAAEVGFAEAVVAAARRRVGHWTAHIGAHEAWVSGEIGEDEKSAIYKRTRLAGPDDQRVYDAAVTKYAEVRGACSRKDDFPESGCMQRLGALAQAMKAGTAAMTDWQSHLDNMAAFAAGEFGVNHAQMLWDRSLAIAPENINAFKRSDQAVRAAPTCG